MATIKDISRATNLSLATVSNYLNGHKVKEPNRIAIEKAINEMDYTVNVLARGLRANRSMTIGVVIPELSNVFISSIIMEMESVLRNKGYLVVVCDCHSDCEQEKEIVSLLMNKRVDGIVNMPTTTDGTHLTPALERGLPIVLVDRLPAPLKEKVSAVLIDNIGGVFAAISKLIEMGHQSIGVVLGPQDVFTTSQRHLGYSSALVQNSILLRDEYIIYSDYTVQGGYESMNNLLKLREMTAVFVSNYEMTLGAIIAINEQGIQIPDELSIIGFDNQQLSQVVRPKLTIVTQPLAEIGQTAAEILLDMLENRKSPRKNVVATLDTSMLHGDSVKNIAK